MPKLRRRNRKEGSPLVAVAAFAWLLLLGSAAASGGGLTAEPVINDVSGLNPIHVREVIAPTSVDEVVAVVRSHAGPISIGGGRYSMGGQTATDGATQIDMRRLDRVIFFSKENKEIVVQAGITWRSLQDYIDPYGLSVEIMQSYSNFTVGGSLSVNAHGRYVGRGPLVASVKAIRIVLANGDVTDATPDNNRDLFYGAIGGYGGLGVIVEATLELTDNVRVERHTAVMPLSRYRTFFVQNIRNNPAVIFHNADLYPDDFTTVRVSTYIRTTKPATVKERLIPRDKSYSLDRLMLAVDSEWPGGKWLRQYVVDPWEDRGETVEWRNHEASYDVAEVEPASKEESTYVLQEYFVPTARLELFVGTMREVLRRHKVNTINVSIRHASADPGTLLAWARSEVFACVLYYKQGTSQSDRSAVEVWTRELIDAAISDGGSYYLPYQILATKGQFLAAYPNAQAFFTLKRRVDPTYKFRNRLWDAYYR
jgi:FAD/FMN-containing dehydrogenase